ncbi:DNA dependent reverse transcriptase, partial [Pseudoloma neurophilia]
LDLKDGYYQVNFAKEDRMKTAFLDPKGRLMQFTKMPQGFKNSPAIFQRGMQIVLKDLLYEKCFCYLDDILVFGKDENEHDENFKEVKGKLDGFGLKMNEEKSKIRMKEVDFFGYRLKDRVSPRNCRFRSTKNKERLEEFSCYNKL